MNLAAIISLEEALANVLQNDYSVVLDAEKFLKIHIVLESRF